MGRAHTQDLLGACEGARRLEVPINIDRTHFLFYPKLCCCSPSSSGDKCPGLEEVVLCGVELDYSQCQGWDSPRVGRLRSDTVPVMSQSRMSSFTNFHWAVIYRKTATCRH